MAATQPRTSHRSLFKKKINIPVYLRNYKIWPVPCPYVPSLMNFIVSNPENVQTNWFVHNINTRNKHHFHRSNANLSFFSKKAYFQQFAV